MLLDQVPDHFLLASHAAQHAHLSTGLHLRHIGATMSVVHQEGPGPQARFRSQLQELHSLFKLV